jgi:Zn finger protein HypA/HybF involved in hydrogenase expression
VNVPRITDHGSALQISSFTLEKLVLKLASEINAEISTFSSIHNEKLSKVIKVLYHKGIANGAEIYLPLF